MDKKVTELTEATKVNNNDIFMIVQNGENKKTEIHKILQLVFPIGSTYITQEDVNPSTILGFGTWERLKGKVCLGLDEDDENLNEIGKTGGEKKHALTTNEMPSQVWHSGDNTGGVNISLDDIGANYGAHTQGTNLGQPHNNMQPYEVVGYMWIRRA